MLNFSSAAKDLVLRCKPSNYEFAVRSLHTANCNSTRPRRAAEIEHDWMHAAEAPPKVEPQPSNRELQLNALWKSSGEGTRLDARDGGAAESRTAA